MSKLTNQSHSQRLFNTNKNETNYNKIFIFLKGQSTILQNYQEKIQQTIVNVSNLDSNIILSLQYIIDYLVNSSYSTLFEVCRNTAAEIQQFLQKNLPNELEKISLSILSSIIAIGRLEFVLTYKGTAETKDFNDSNTINFCDFPSELFNVIKCDICNNLIKSDFYQEHRLNCSIAHESQLFVFSADDNILKLINKLNLKYLNESWFLDESKCIEIYIPCLHLVSLLKKSLILDLNDPESLFELINIGDIIILLLEEIGNSSLKKIIYESSILISQKINGSSIYQTAIVAANSSKSNHNPIKYSFSISDFKFIQRISSGAFSRVFLATKGDTLIPYAIKVISKNNLTQKNSMKRLLIERDIMIHINSPFTINFIHSTIGYNNFYLVMEYLPGGDLHSLLDRSGSLSESDSKYIIIHIILALQYLREKLIIHRDLKPSNLIFDKNGHLKLSDFGLSYYGVSDPKFNQNNEVSEQNLIGTPDYIAPEVILLQPHSFQADYWSLGIILFELLTGLPPFHRDSIQETLSAILKGNINYLELDGISNDCIDLIQQLLNPNQNNRIGSKSILEIKNHKWFNNIDWNNLNNLKPIFIPEIKSIYDVSNFEERDSPYSNFLDNDILFDIKHGLTQIHVGNLDNDLPEFLPPKSENTPPTTHKRKMSFKSKSIISNI